MLRLLGNSRDHLAGCSCVRSTLPGFHFRRVFSRLGSRHFLSLLDVLVGEVFHVVWKSVSGNTLTRCGNSICRGFLRSINLVKSYLRGNLVYITAWSRSEFGVKLAGVRSGYQSRIVELFPLHHKTELITCKSG